MPIYTNARKVFLDCLLEHEYISTAKIVHKATEKLGLTEGQTTYALASLRDDGWVKWQQCDSNSKQLKWKRVNERLLTPMEPSRRVSRGKKGNGVAGHEPDELEAMTMPQLVTELERLAKLQHRVHVVLQNRFKLLR